MTAGGLGVEFAGMAETAAQRKKRKKRNVVLDYMGYVALRVLVVVLYLFAIERNLGTARFLGRKLWRYYHRGRRRALGNLRASFPEKSEEWIWQTGQRSFEQMAMMAMDVIFTPKLVKKYNWRSYARFKGAERAKWMMKEGKGLLMVTGHYGNFEIMGYMMGLFGFDIYSVARPLDNKFISRWLYGVRQRAGQRIVDKKGASRWMDEIVGRGSTLAFIADQDAGRKGIFVDFFGRKASTYKSIGLLAITNNMPICVGYSRRVGDGFFFEMGMTRLIMPDEWADKEDPLRWVTAEYTRAIEDFIREDPTQYWWLHRRWKHRPKEELRELEAAKARSEV